MSHDPSPVVPNLSLDAPYVRLGDFVLDLQQQLLFDGLTEIAAEPKVLQLLVYFYQHRARYVSLEELHQQVWADRIVSDTAVRSAVKKLRLLLNDDLANPVYLKSVSKRGYKLICAVQALSEYPAEISHPENLLVTDAMLAAQGGYAADPAMVAEEPHRQFSGKQVLGLLFLTLITLWYSSRDTTIDLVPAANPLHITNFEGEKRALTVSADGRYIAFTGRMSPEQDTQVYLFDQHTKHLRQLTTQAKNAFFVSFIHHDKALVYSDSVTGSSSMHLLPLTVAEPEQAVSALLTGKHLIGQLVQGRHSAEILFVMMEQSAAAAMVYALDVNTMSINRVVTVSQPNTFIYGLQLSPDRQQLAFLKREHDNQQLVIFNLSTKHESKILDLLKPVLSLNWRNERQLLMLDADAIRLLDITNGDTRRVYDNPQGLISAMTSHDSKQLTLIHQEKARADRLFIEQSLSVDSHNSTIIDAPAQVIAMRYSNYDQYKWLTLLNNNIYAVARIAKGSQEPEIIYQSHHVLEMLDVDETNQKLLLQENNRLLVLSVKDGAVVYLTSLADHVSDAVFSLDKRTVLYGQQIAGSWEIMQYELQTSAVTVLFNDFRSVRQADAGYVLADAEGQLFYLEKPAAPALNLAHRISFEPVTRWSVNNNKIIWTTFDYRQTSVHQLQLRSGQYQVMHRAYLSLYPRIAISPHAEHMLYLSVQLNDASLSLLPLIAE